jgi:hypothetical protein
VFDLKYWHQLLCKDRRSVLLLRWSLLSRMKKVLSEYFLFIWCSSLFLTVVLQHVAQSYQVGSISESSSSQRSFEKTGGCRFCVSKISCFDYWNWQVHNNKSTSSSKSIQGWSDDETYVDWLPCLFIPRTDGL